MTSISVPFTDATEPINWVINLRSEHFFVTQQISFEMSVVQNKMKGRSLEEMETIHFDYLCWWRETEVQRIKNNHFVWLWNLSPYGPLTCMHLVCGRFGYLKEENESLLVIQNSRLTSKLSVSLSSCTIVSKTSSFILRMERALLSKSLKPSVLAELPMSSYFP